MTLAAWVLVLGGRGDGNHAHKPQVGAFTGGCVDRADAQWRLDERDKMGLVGLR